MAIQNKMIDEQLVAEESDCGNFGFAVDVLVDLDLAKKAKIAEIDRRTEAKLNNEGVTIDFDFGGGVSEHTFAATKTAKTNWILLMNCARDCMDGKVSEGLFFPMNVQMFPSESFISLSTPVIAFQFSYAVLGAIETCRGMGAVLKNQVSGATTIEEIEAIIDNR